MLLLTMRHTKMCAGRMTLPNRPQLWAGVRTHECPWVVPGGENSTAQANTGSQPVHGNHENNHSLGVHQGIILSQPLLTSCISIRKERHARSRSLPFARSLGFQLIVACAPILLGGGVGRSAQKTNCLLLGKRREQLALEKNKA